MTLHLRVEPDLVDGLTNYRDHIHDGDDAVPVSRAEAVRAILCQTALKIDPLSACNIDPLRVVS